jgi:UDP-glucose:glycoprotein glucosyltransferase
MRWPKTVKALLQPNWPGQMYYVRKNLMTLVLVFDPASDQGLQMAAMAYQILQQQMPIRVGIAPVVVNPAGQAGSRPTEWTLEEHGIKDHMFQCAADPSSESPVASTEKSISEKVYRIYRFVRFKTDNMTALQFLLSLFTARHQRETAPSTPLNEEELLQVFSEFVKENLPDQEDESDIKGLFQKQMTAKRFNTAVASAERYAREKGFLQLPVGLINGRIMPGDQIQRQLMRALMGEQSMLQELVSSQQIDDETNIEDFVLSHNSALEHFHPDLAMASPNVVSIDAALNMPTGAATTATELSRQLLVKTPYFLAGPSDPEHPVTVTMWLVTDLETAEGVDFAREALHFIRQSPENVRIAVLSAQESATHAVVPRALAAAAQLELADPQKGAVLAAAVLELAHRNLSVPVAVVEHLAGQLLPAEAAKSFTAAVADAQRWSSFFSTQHKFCNSVLKLQPGETALVTNGRVVRAAADVPLSSDDLFALSVAEHKLRAKSVSEIVASHKEHSWAQIEAASPKAYSNLDSFVADQILMASSVFFAPDEEKSDSSMRGAYMPPVFEKDTPLLREITVHAGTDQSSAPLNIVAALDPLSRDAQRLAPVLLFLTKLFPLSVKLILYPPSSLGELPLKNFYRYVLPSSDLVPGNDRPAFGADGSLIEQPRAVFDRLPEDSMLTLNMDSPGAWQMEPVTSGHDMDNIKLSQITDSTVFAKYKIAHLYVQGNAAEQPSRQPPRGLQLALDTTATIPSTISDTIVMANLGYFQLKASPGKFNLHMVDGRSTELYTMNGGDHLYPSPTEGQLELTVDSFTGLDVTLAVAKKPGMEKEELLQVPENAKLDTFQRLRAMMFGGSSGGTKKKELATVEDETIHVFSLASGHLYERFLRIMMLSVIHNTKSPVKFWFLKNFLSARFTQFFLPKLAKKHSIQYELVTYRWPSWLHQQTERQRIIWGHKILFLDVLFPLNVKKVVYIDADQVVRGDLKELWDMDLEGAPLAMTPMCDDRKEVEGFRFWKQGFWKSHLAGKPYHISALFVVDLEMWRATAAGDQFRVVYEQLSKDKNSLANLDQDLPNYAQHQVPIYSLPPQWLWCGSWCSQESKAEARTIDLCNDPLKKTPKLDMARAILPEWVDLDKEGQAIEDDEELE